VSATQKEGEPRCQSRALDRDPREKKERVKGDKKQKLLSKMTLSSEEREAEERHIKEKGIRVPS